MKIMRMAIAAGCLALSGQALAEVRIIAEDGRGSPEPGMRFQDHTNNTPHVGPGGTINVPRSSDTFVWVYEHGIDLLPTSMDSSNAKAAAAEFRAIGGRASNVYLPLGLGQMAPAGARAYKVNAGRELPIGTRVTLTVRKPVGTIQMTGRVTCPAAGVNEELSRLTGLATSKPSFAPGEQGSMTIDLDQVPACQGQTMRISLPSCFQTALPGSPRRFSTEQVRIEPSDPRRITLPLFARPSGEGSCASPTGEISVTVGNDNRRVAVTYAEPRNVQQARPINSGGTGLQAPRPTQPSGTVTPRPKPPGGI